MKEVWVFRLGHRISRDKRISTHCSLVARAFGATGMFYSGQKDPGLEDSVKKVVKNWGGKFRLKYEKNWKRFLGNWKGKIAHLTVYGVPLEKAMKKIRPAKGKLLVVIGGEKVPGEVYHLSDWNVSVTGQPHSEVASLALFLDRVFRGKEFSLRFKGKLKVVPQERGKKVIKT